MRQFFSLFFSRRMLADVLPVALVVGTVLNVVNACYQPLSVTQIIFHYLLPYCVASYGAVKNQYRQQRSERDNARDRDPT